MTDADAWVDDVGALCVTVIAGSTPEGAAHAIGLDDLAEFPDAATAAAWTTEGDAYDRAWFATGTIEGRTFVWEVNGWQGVTEEAALRLAAGDELTSVSWNVEAVMSFLRLEEGRVVRQFDPLFHDDQEPPTPAVGQPLPEESWLDWAQSPQRAGLALLARLARTPPVDPAWLLLPGVRFWGHRF